MIITLTTLALNIFPATVSPSTNFGIAHDTKAGADINQLVDLRDMRVLATLKGFSGFEDENHGGVFASYSKTESYAAVMQAGKWEPRALCLLSTKTGSQVDLLRKVQVDSASYLAKNYKKSKRTGYVFDVSGAKFDDNKVSFAMIGQVPMSDDSPTYNLSLTYTVKVVNGKWILSAPTSKPLNSAKVWVWSKQR